MTNKAFKTNWNQIFESDANDFYCVSINRPMALAIISQLQYLRWLTRWDNAPSQDAIDEFTDSIESALLTLESECAEVVNCGQVEDCIDSVGGAEVIIKLTQPQAGNNVVQQNTINNVQNIFNQLTTLPATDCDDYIFGTILQFITYLEQVLIDTLEAIEASPASNFAEFLDAFSGVTFIDEAGIDVVTGLYQWLFDNLVDAFPAAANAERRNDLACQIFCTVEGTCQVTINDVALVINQNVESLNPAPTSFINVLEWASNVLNVVVGGDPDLAYAMGMQLLIGQVQLLNKVAGSIGLDGNAALKLLAYWKSFQNDPNPDHTTLCDCADTGWCRVFNFSTGLNAWTISTNTGGVIPFGALVASGIESRNARSPQSGGGYWRRAQVNRSFASTVITRIVVTFDVTLGASNVPAGSNMHLIVVDGDVLVQVTLATAVSGTDLTMEWNGSRSATSINTFVTSSQRTNNSYSGNAILKSIRVEGEGTDPFIALGGGGAC